MRRNLFNSRSPQPPSVPSTASLLRVPLYYKKRTVQFLKIASKLKIKILKTYIYINSIIYIYIQTSTTTCTHVADTLKTNDCSAAKTDAAFSHILLLDNGESEHPSFAIRSLSSRLHPISPTLVRIVYGIASLEAKSFKGSKLKT